MNTYSTIFILASGLDQITAHSAEGIPVSMNELKKELNGVILWSRVLIEK
jgi:hypothetical protein